MKLFEYQAKNVFKEEGIPIPENILIEEVSQMEEGIKQIGCPCVIKSQVLQGGRGKAGLVCVVKDKETAVNKTKELFESKHNVKKILLEEAINIEKEIYLSITIEPVEAKAMIIACSEGGVEIEKLAEESPEKIVRESVDLNTGLMGYQANDVAYKLGLDVDLAKQFSKILLKLYKIFSKYDAELVEINPLFVTKEGKVIAGDGKLNIDDNSTSRQQRFEKSREYYTTDMEYNAALEGIPYLQFDGDIGLMCAGAGLTTTVYDLINYTGGTIANYLEFGGPNYKKAVKAMELCLQNKSKVILMVSFGTIARADVLAEGVRDAIIKLKPDRPIITCIRGTNEEAVKEILKDSNVECFFDTEEAVKRAVELSKGGDN